MKTLLATTLLGSLVLASTTALASAVAAVRVECNAHCEQITLSDVCSTVGYMTPVSISCVKPQGSAGGGTGVACGSGSGICYDFGALVSGDIVSSYCADVNGVDAIVMCQY